MRCPNGGSVIQTETAVALVVQSALRLKPFFTDAYNNMASALVQKGLIPQAMECYMSALRINPNLVSFAGAVCRGSMQGPCGGKCAGNVFMYHKLTRWWGLIMGHRIAQ
jgi:tetratricopeptide (TPR) repeat protein